MSTRPLLETTAAELTRTVPCAQTSQANLDSDSPAGTEDQFFLNTDMASTRDLHFQRPPCDGAAAAASSSPGHPCRDLWIIIASSQENGRTWRNLRHERLTFDEIDVKRNPKNPAVGYLCGCACVGCGRSLVNPKSSFKKNIRFVAVSPRAGIFPKSCFPHP